MNDIVVRRLGSDDRTAARAMFAMMVDVFDGGSGDDDGELITDDYLDRLLSQHSFWALAAFVGSEIVGGLTAHILPMTKSETSEIFVYDLAAPIYFYRAQSAEESPVTLFTFVAP